MRILGELIMQVRTESGEIEFPAGDKHGHSSSPLRTGDGNTVHISMGYTRKRANRLGHLGSRNIFSFPTECIANPIDKVEVPLLISSHQVATSKPRVARLEDVSQ